MIGHFLGTLDTAAEDRILMGRLCAGSLRDPGAGEYVHGNSRCLVGAAHDAYKEPGKLWASFRHESQYLTGWGSGDCIEMQFDMLIMRFGAPRVTAAIRNRILSNRARRALSLETVPAGHSVTLPQPTNASRGRSVPPNPETPTT